MTPEQENNKNNFLTNLRSILDSDIYPDTTDEYQVIAPHSLKALSEIGAFAMKIPTNYGGQGLSSVEFSKALMACGAKCGSVSATLLASQGLGAPAFLLKYGNEEQKAKYLPKFSSGSVSALALTERHAGSNPRNITSEAEETRFGHFLLNGEKTWCTNGHRADIIIVIAKSSKNKFSAFIVESNYKGVSMGEKCEFSGLKGAGNGVIKFKNVRIPKENIISPESCGIKIALEILIDCRVFLSAVCVGGAKAILKESREWGSRRCQWGKCIGEHELISDKITRIARDTFAMESVVLLTTSIMDKKNTNIKEESAMTKIWCTETCWSIVNEAMRIRGGRGYETAKSLSRRGEKPSAIERLFRDIRSSLILDGSNEVLSMLLAKEAFGPRTGPKPFLALKSDNKNLKTKIKFLKKTSNRLSLRILFSKIRYKKTIKEKQLLLHRISKIKTELFVLYACIRRCQTDPNPTLINLLDSVFHEAKNKTNQNFYLIKNNRDKEEFRLAQDVLMEKYKKLEELS